MYICFEKYGKTDNLPQFGIIKSMCVQYNNLYFYLEIAKTINFSNVYFGFTIEHTNTKTFIEVQYNNLKIKESFCSWTPINSNDKKIIYKKSLVFD